MAPQQNPQRREIYCLLAGSAVLNVLVTFVVVLTLTGRGRELLLGGGQSFDSIRPGRKLLQAETMFLAWQANEWVPFKIAIQSSLAGITASPPGEIVITRKVRFLGGLEVVGSWLNTTATRVQLRSQSSLTIDQGSTLTTDTLSVAGLTRLGTGFSGTKELDPRSTVLKVLGSIQVGRDAKGSTAMHRTVISPGKVSMSWPSPNPQILANTWIGKAADDDHSKNQLSVYGNASLVTSRAKPFTFTTRGASL